MNTQCQWRLIPDPRWLVVDLRAPALMLPPIPQGQTSWALAIDAAVCLLKYPVPDDAARRQALAIRFAKLIGKHDTLRAQTAAVLAKGMIAKHWQALLDIKFEPAARDWMRYFIDVLEKNNPCPMLLGTERAPA